MCAQWRSRCSVCITLLMHSGFLWVTVLFMSIFLIRKWKTETLSERSSSRTGIRLTVGFKKMSQVVTWRQSLTHLSPANPKMELRFHITTVLRPVSLDLRTSSWGFIVPLSLLLPPPQSLFYLPLRFFSFFLPLLLFKMHIRTHI